jgi:peptidoglycan hydrolase-like protein with peptidoglycan-binding domain
MLHGADVATWQAQMLKRGWTTIGAADGFYGPRCRDVCVAFQTEKHLSVDGIVGPVTWAASWTSPIT